MGAVSAMAMCLSQALRELTAKFIKVNTSRRQSRAVLATDVDLWSLTVASSFRLLV